MAKRPARNVKTATTPNKKAPARKLDPEQKVAAPKQKAVNAHAELSHGYTGESAPINANRPVKIMIRDHKPSITADRQAPLLYALRKEHAGRQFPARGLDNGILSALLAAGLITYKGGAVETLNGKDYIRDADEPVMLNITPAGQKYGLPA